MPVAAPPVAIGPPVVAEPVAASPPAPQAVPTASSSHFKWIALLVLAVVGYTGWHFMSKPPGTPSTGARVAADTGRAGNVRNEMRIAGTVSRMTVEGQLVIEAAGNVLGYWLVTNDPKLQGQRFRLEGTSANGRLQLKEFEGSRHALDIELQLEAGTLRGKAYNRPPLKEIWDVNLLTVPARQGMSTDSLAQQQAIAVAQTFHAATVPATADAKPSFDCAKATSRSERLVCSSTEVARQDVAMANAYRGALARSGARAPDIRRSQLDWLRDSRESCTDVACLLRIYEARILELRRIAEADQQSLR